MRWRASVACAGVSNVTNPKPRERFVALSTMTLAARTGRVKGGRETVGLDAGSRDIRTFDDGTVRLESRA